MQKAPSNNGLPYYANVNSIRILHEYYSTLIYLAQITVASV